MSVRLFIESVRMAFRSLRANKLRAALTLLSMAIGVFAIVGVAAAVGALDSTLSDQLVSLGRNDFSIRNRSTVVVRHGAGNRNRYAPITLRQALRFEERMEPYAQIGLQSSLATVRATSGELSTDNDVNLIGGDQQFTLFSGYTIEQGRTFDPFEVQQGSDVALIGADVAADLDLLNDAAGEGIRLDGHTYRVIGRLEARGAIMGQSQDNLIIVPLRSGAKYFFNQNEESMTIQVRAADEKDLQVEKDRAIGILRAIRGVEVGTENTFEVVSQEDIAETVGGFTKYISFFGLFCGVIALIAAGVGVMNIMLVTVKERTREIGIRKAVGASNGAILRQFLVEAITICQIGALIGVLGGIGVGLGLAAVLKSSLALPWTSILVSSAICLAIGIIFGSYPAYQAARLDPIESLRYE